MRFCAAALGILCLCVGLSAQRWFVTEHQPAERVAGLLDLPDVTGNYADDACRQQASSELYAKPSTAGPTIGTVYLREHPDFGCAFLLKRAGSSTEEEL